MEEEVVEGVNLRPAVELHTGPVDDVVTVLVIRSAVVIPQAIAVAVADPVVVPAQDQIAAPFIHRGRDEDAIGRVTRV